MSIPERDLRLGFKIAKATILRCRTEFFFCFVQNNVYQGVFWSEIYRRLPKYCNYTNIISGSQTKVEKTEFFIVFSTFDSDPEIIM